MFESLFQYPTVLARHRDGPAADERRRFLLHRAKEGAARDTLLRIARGLSGHRQTHQRDHRQGDWQARS
jgi:hypothetical protein